MEILIMTDSMLFCFFLHRLSKNGWKKSVYDPFHPTSNAYPSRKATWRLRNGANGGRSVMRSGLPWTAESSVECTASPEKRNTTTKSTSKEKSCCFALHDKWPWVTCKFDPFEKRYIFRPLWLGSKKKKTRKKADTCRDFRVSPKVTLTL